MAYLNRLQHEKGCESRQEHGQGRRQRMSQSGLLPDSLLPMEQIDQAERQHVAHTGAK